MLGLLGPSRTKRWPYYFSFLVTLLFAVSLTVESSPAWADEAVKYYKKGISYGDEGKWDEAIVWFKEAVRLKPDFKWAHIRLGYAYMKKERFEEAIASYKEARRLDPEGHLAPYFMGSAYQKMGQWDEAFAAYEEAIRLEPDYAPAHWRFGMAHVGIGDREKAIEEYRWLKDRKPGLAENLFAAISSMPAAGLTLREVRVEPSSVAAGSSVDVVLDYTVSGSEQSVREENRIVKDGQVLARFPEKFTRRPGRYESNSKVRIPVHASPGAYSLVGVVSAGGKEMSLSATLEVTR